MDDNTIISFGIHKGKKLANVPGSYLLFLYEKKSAPDELLKYIEDNLEIIRSEVVGKKNFK